MKRLIDNESGSAMTEFVIGLPVFILIFHGINVLYHFNHQGFVTMAEAERSVWQQSLEIQTERLADPTRMSPLTNVGSDLFGGDSNRSVQEALDTTSSISLWADSGIKAELPTSLLDDTVEPHLTFEDVIGSAELYSHDLQNDLVAYDGFGGAGWAGAFGAALDGTGARPAIAAGYRYGVVRGEATQEFEGPIRDSTIQMTATFTMPAPTYPTNRFNAVALTRIQLAEDVRYNEAIPIFDGQVKTREGEEELGGSNDCAAELREWALCNQSCNDGAVCRCGDRPSCEDLNPMQSLSDEACEIAEGAPACQ